MEHHYDINLSEIAAQANKLAYMKACHGPSFWLHIDNDKLSKCRAILDSLVDAINDEIDGVTS